MITNAKKKQYAKYTDDDRYNIGKYASENGTSAEIFEEIRGIKEKYKEHIKNVAREKHETPLKKGPLGRPLMLGEEFDAKVQNYIKAVRSRSGPITFEIANATAEALIQSNPKYDLNINIRESYWAQSLFRRLGGTANSGNGKGYCAIKSPQRNQVDVSSQHFFQKSRNSKSLCRW